MKTPWKVTANCRKRKPRGTMNKLEQRYADELESRKYAGEVAWWAFEAVTFVLAKDLRYTPDFLVMLSDGSLEVHEAKGHWEAHARVKIKAAAEKFPMRFIALKAVPKKDGGGWSVEEF